MIISIINMRKVILLYMFFICGYSLCYGQLFTYDLQRLMNSLPRTADDFQSRFYDTELESATSVSSLTFPSFEGVPIMKHNGSISKMTFQIFNTIERFGERYLNDTPNYSVTMTFNSNGTLTHLKGAHNLFAPNVPCSSHVGTGIDLSIDNDMTVEYTRDEQQRVIEAQVLDSGNPYLIFRYAYLANSKKITTVKGYDYNGKLIGEVLYSYNNGRLSQLYYKGYSIYSSRLETEFKKLYTYDGHGNYSKIDISRWHGTKSAGYQQVYTFENQYDSKGQLTTSRVGFSQSYNSGNRGGTPFCHSRKFTYDNHGNWIKVESTEGQVAIRQFEFK